MPRLESWAVVFKDRKWLTTKPETKGIRLVGHVYDHPDHLDGKTVTTTPINIVHDGKVITYTGTVYELGEVNESYGINYPDAKNRLLKEGSK